MSNIDKRNKLKEKPFSYRVAKENRVFIYCSGKQIKILKGKESEKFLADIAKADAMQAQLLMAKITGNFKHGKEKIKRPFQ